VSWKRLEGGWRSNLLEISGDLLEISPKSLEISRDLQLSERSPWRSTAKKIFLRYSIHTYVGGTAATRNFVGSRFFGETLRNIRLN
jgi:hypothetical protein